MAAPQQPLPTRTLSVDEDAIPDEDSSEVTRLFHERLQAWKHACGYLEDYITATEKAHNSSVKEYEKVLKTVSNPLKEGHHFDQTLGGIAGLFDNIRTNTQGIANSNAETVKTLKGSVLPIFERLHAEIKNKTKELTKGAGKGAKAVDKARQTSQKHIELLGQHTAAFQSTGGNVKASEDPYIIQRQVYHRLNKQVIEENNNRDDMIAVQNNFSSFEAHIVQTFQAGLRQFNQVVANQTEQTRAMYGDILATSERVAPGFEWKGFITRNANLLIDPSAPKRNVQAIAFPNQDHQATQPLIAGSLERKGKMLKSYSTGFYVITPSKYLHEFKSDDDFAKDPTPETSLYLPDCLIGGVNGQKFNISGKNSSKGAIGSAFTMSHEYAFKAHTAADAQKWHDVIASVAGGKSNAIPDDDGNSPQSPATATSPTIGTDAKNPGAASANPNVTSAEQSTADAAAEKEAAHAASTT